MVNIIFLDIDGVLNSRRHLLTLKGKSSTFDVMDPEAVARLNQITAATKSMLVISSTWRIPYLISGNIVKLRLDMLMKGIKAPVIGMTPDSGRIRGDQIQSWLDTNMKDTPCSFIILDDDSDMGHLTDRLVKTTFEDGLMDAHVVQAIALLRGDPTS